MTGRRSPSVLFYVQHMLGVGHIFRARRIVEGLSRHGYQVDVVFGGTPVEEQDFSARSMTFLPPVKAGAIDYSFYTDADGNALSRDYLANRQAKLLSAFDTLSPDLIVIEQFPFGRRVLRPELLALLDRAHARQNRPLIVCSVRDILQEKRKAGRTEEAIAAVETLFDAVLVHSDPSVISLGATLPLADRIADKLHYTGFVVPEDRDGAVCEIFDVVVTAGGGAFGEGLLRCALAAHRHTSLKPARWCLVTGPNLPRGIADELRQTTPPGMAVRTFLPNLWRYLEQAKLSISQAGYNTVADILRARCHSVLIPSDIAGQTEQLRRAELLSAAGLAVNLPESEATPEKLAAAMEMALAQSPDDRSIDMSGIQSSVRIIDRLMCKQGR